jgi:hypothetical protein
MADFLRKVLGMTDLATAGNVAAAAATSVKGCSKKLTAKNSPFARQTSSAARPPWKGSAIVYCRTRAKCDEMAMVLG